MARAWIAKRPEKRGIRLPSHGQSNREPQLRNLRHVAGIRQLQSEQGLNAYLRSQPVCEVSVDSAEVLRDLDTPEDYERLQRLP